MPQTKDGYITEKDHLKSLRKTTRDIFESARTRMASVSGKYKSSTRPSTILAQHNDNDVSLDTMFVIFVTYCTGQMSKKRKSVVFGNGATSKHFQIFNLHT